MVVLFALYQLRAVAGQWDVLPRELERKTDFVPYWPASWHMFTLKATHNIVYSFEHRMLGGEWQRTPMEEYLPFRWCHGHRWERGSLKRSRRLRRPFIWLACDRTGAHEVRVIRESWRITPGQQAQPPKRYDKQTLDGAACDRVPPPKASGRVL